MSKKKSIPIRSYRQDPDDPNKVWYADSDDPEPFKWLSYYDKKMNMCGYCGKACTDHRSFYCDKKTDEETFRNVHKRKLTRHWEAGKFDPSFRLTVSIPEKKKETCDTNCECHCSPLSLDDYIKFTFGSEERYVEETKKSLPPSALVGMADWPMMSPICEHCCQLSYEFC